MPELLAFHADICKKDPRRQIIINCPHLPAIHAHTCISLTGDLDAAVRLCLEKLGALGQAAALARKSHSIPAAALVAQAALASGEVQLALEFLLLAGQLDQAFDLAAAKGQLAAFGQLAASSIKVGF
jgi:WD repeat-containing protein 19